MDSNTLSRVADMATVNLGETEYFPFNIYRLAVKQDEDKAKELHFHIIAKNGDCDIRVKLNGDVMSVVYNKSNLSLSKLSKDAKKWLKKAPTRSSSLKSNIQLVMEDWTAENDGSYFEDKLNKEITRLQKEEVDLDEVYNNVMF